MKAKIKKGHEYLFSLGASNDWKDITDTMIINFKDKYTYKHHKQKGNHLLIKTTEGDIDIVFTSSPPVFKSCIYCKDQLVLYTKKL